MKKIKALRTTFAGGDLLEAGKTYEVEDRVATDLVAVKKAELVEAKKKAAKKRAAKEVADEPADETENDAAQDGDGLPLEG